MESTPRRPAASSPRAASEARPTLGILFLGYRLMHRALRLRWMQRLVVATSLTHFAFWKRYRAPKGSVSGGAP